MPDHHRAAYRRHHGRRAQRGRQPARQQIRAAAAPVAEQAADYAGLSTQQAASMLKKLEAQMYKHAQNLEFEDAAKLRDQIHQSARTGPALSAWASWRLRRILSSARSHSRILRGSRGKLWRETGG